MSGEEGKATSTDLVVADMEKNMAVVVRVIFKMFSPNCRTILTNLHAHRA